MSMLKREEWTKTIPPYSDLGKMRQREFSSIIGRMAKMFPHVDEEAVWEEIRLLSEKKVQT